MARTFNGTTDAAVNSGSPISGFGLTLACWFNPDTVTRAEDLMSLSDVAAITHGFRLSLRGDAAGDFVHAGQRGTSVPSQANAITSAGYSAGTWQHAAAVFTGGSSRAAFLNGANKGTDTTAQTTTFANLNRVGLGGYNSTSLFNPLQGKLAYPCIWNVALTDDEIASLGAGFHPTLIRPSAIVAMWELNQGASPEPDSWGGFALTLTGTSQADDPAIIYPSGVISVNKAVSAPAFKSAWARRSNVLIHPGAL